MIKPLALMVAMMLLACGVLASDRERAQQLLDSADARFRAALVEKENASAMAPESFLDAARTYESIADMGFDNPDLWLDAGNAYLLGGEVGRAVLAFRRADLLRPYDRNVRSGLADARERVQISVSQSSASRATQVATYWRRFIPVPFMIGAFVVLYVGAWTVAIINGIRPALVPRAAGLGLALASGLIATLVLVEHRTNDGDRSGVVIAEGITARNGPSASVYEPTFTTPLRPGVELRILETRDGWHKVRLADGRETWLPEHAIERVKARGDGSGPGVP